MFQRSRVTAVVGGPNNGVPYDFRYWAPQLLGRSIWQSVSNCGLAGASTITPDDVPLLGLGVPVRRLRRAEHRGPRGRARRPRQHVTRPYGAATLFPGSANALGLLALADLGRDRPEHRQHAHPRDREPAALQPRRRTRCAATAQTCSSFVSAGVELDRLIMQQGDGRQALVTDTWSATDGRHHEIDVFYEHRLGGSAPVVSFPWAGGFTSYPPGLHAEAAAHGAVQLLHARVAERRRRRRRRTRRARSRCRTARPPCASSTSTALWTQYVRTRHARDAHGHPFGFSWATSQADLTTLIGAAERALGPTHCLVPNLVGKTLVDRQAPAAGRALQGRQGQARDLEACGARTTSSSRAVARPRRWRAGARVALLVSSRLIGEVVAGSGPAYSVE